jgi:hypothetical protein
MISRNDVDDDLSRALNDPALKSEGLLLVKLFTKIKAAEDRHKVIQLAQQLSAERAR